MPFGFSDRFIEIEDSDLMSVAKGLDVPDQQAKNHADRGSRHLADSALRHSCGAVARTLNNLLDEAEAPLTFDLLSLDVEGNELSVLKGFDFESYLPKWILVETRGPEVADYLTKYDYKIHSILTEHKTYPDVLFFRD